jgi:hypothetical protein
MTKRIEMEAISKKAAEGFGGLTLTKYLYVYKDPFVAMRSTGDTDYTCGGCGALILKSVNVGQVKGLVFPCAGCKTDNRVRGI